MIIEDGVFLFCWQVSGVAFDSYWSPPSSDGNGENVYRFGSVGQVCQVKYSTKFVYCDHVIIVTSSTEGLDTGFFYENDIGHLKLQDLSFHYLPLLDHFQTLY